MIYLDHAAATPLDPAVFKVMEPYLTERFYNPSAIYLAAKAVAKDMGEARAQIAHYLGTRPSEVIFTAGGTEANNLAIGGIMQMSPQANIVVSAIEHEAVLEPAAKYRARKVTVKPDGRVDLKALEAAIDDDTKLVSIMYANNEIGTIEPLKEVAQLVQKVRQERREKGVQLPLYFHTDACQAANYLDLHAARLGVDLMTLNAGKIYGPKQCGALYVKTGVELLPQMLGGGQERGLRSGTENVANIIGFAKALAMAQDGRHEEVERLKKLQEQCIKAIQQHLPDAVINGSLQHRLPNNVHITLPGHDNERLMMQLDEAGIMCATGSACTASNDLPSHVLSAIGLSNADAQASLRFTMGRSTTEDDIQKTVQQLQAIC